MNELPFNACDYRCEHCLVTGECAVYQKLRERSLQHALDGGDEHELAAVLRDIRESFRETEARIKQKARDLGIDIDELSGNASPAKDGTGSSGPGDAPLYRQALDFTMHAQGFLRSAQTAVGEGDRDYLDDIAWHHTVVAAKIYRALGWRTDGENAVDAADSAAVAIKSLTICIMAFDYIASRYPMLLPACRTLAAEARQIKEEIRARIRPARAA